MSSTGETRRVQVVRKVAATLAVIAAVTGLELFAAAGSFDDQHEPFPTSVAAHP